jgi:hypothetical protein
MRKAIILLSSNRLSIRININFPQVRDYFFGSSKLILSIKLVSSLEMFFSVVSSSGPDKYYTCHLGEVMVSINNKFIIDRDVLSGEVRVLSIAKSIFFLNIKETGRKFSFLRK